MIKLISEVEAEQEKEQEEMVNDYQDKRLI